MQVPFEPEQLTELEFSSEDPTAWAGDTLIVGVFQEDLGLAGAPLQRHAYKLQPVFYNAGGFVLSNIRK